MDELSAALDALAEDDLTAAFAPALLDRLRGLLVAQNRLAAGNTRTVRLGVLSGTDVEAISTFEGTYSVQALVVGPGHRPVPVSGRRPHR